jgi:elongation factor G
VLLEPIMEVQVIVPDHVMGDVIGDLNSRRGRVLGMDQTGSKGIVTAEVPLAEMLRYSSALRSISGARGVYTMKFVRYERVPQHLQAEIIANATPVEAS